MEQFDNGLQLVNPAKPLTYKYEFLFSDKKYFGLFENIGVNYFSTRLNLSTKSNNSNVVGVNFSNEYEGNYISKNRAHISYLFETKIRLNYSLGLGINGGIFNFQIKNSNSNNGSSSWLSDGNLGIWLRNKKINLGISGNQITNAEDKLYVNNFKLSTFGVVYCDYKHELSALFNVKGGIIAKKYSNTSQLDLFIISKYKNMISGGVNLKTKRGTTFILGLENLEVLHQNFNLTGSYSIQKNNQISFNSNQLELSIKYFIKQF